MRWTLRSPSPPLCSGRKRLQFASVSAPCFGVALRYPLIRPPRPRRATDAVPGSVSPPLFWGMGLGGGGGGGGGWTFGFGFTRLPAGDTANQVPPNAVRSSPLVSPDFVSFTKR